MLTQQSVASIIAEPASDSMMIAPFLFYFNFSSGQRDAQCNMCNGLHPWLPNRFWWKGQWWSEKVRVWLEYHMVHDHPANRTP
jgi:hypothetical protein